MTTPNRRRFRLGADFGPLEDRAVPAQFGTPWPDARNLTLSFVPDQVATPAGKNEIFNDLGSGDSAAAWQREVARAFHTWVMAADLNVGLVADTGVAVGSPGAPQGDGRFGDLRIAAAKMVENSALAVASPFTWAGSTLNGDVLLNTETNWTYRNESGKIDLFSVALHEAGHALGLGNSADPASAMYTKYSRRTGLTADDVAAVQALYGARRPDRYDLAAANDTPFAASPLPAVVPSSTQFAAAGDLTTQADVDHYRLVVPAGTTAVHLRVRAAGLGFLAPHLTLLNAFGTPVAQTRSDDPLRNDLTLRFNVPAGGGTYYLKVDGATADVFGTGRYQVVADLLSAAVPQPAALPPLTSDLATDTSAPPPVSDTRFEVGQTGYLPTGGTATHRVVSTAGNFPAGTAVNLNVMVWGTDRYPLHPLVPLVRVFDAAGNPLPVRVLASEAGVMSVQVPDAVVGAEYTVQVSARIPSGNGSRGAYFLGADFNRDTVDLGKAVATNTLDPNQTRTASLSVTRPGLVQFALAAEPLAAGGGGVTVEVIGPDGKVAFKMIAAAGQPPLTYAQYLGTGTYTLRYRYTAPLSGTAGRVRFHLVLRNLSDPIGPAGSDVTGGDARGAEDGYVYLGASDILPTGLPVIF